MMTMNDMTASTISKINWLKAKRSSTMSKDDVSIRLTGGTDKTKAGYQITLRNQTGLKFDSAIQIGEFKNRLYFLNDTTGYHINVQKREGGRVHGYIKITKTDETKVLDKFVGDYKLIDSDMPGYYYIENKSLEW